MIRNNVLRYLLGIVLAGMAGLSFCLSILPVALEIVGAGSQIQLAAVLSRLAPFSALLWAAGGYAVARAGFLKAGMVIMVVVGVATGLLLVGRGLAADPRWLTAGALAGLVYGLVGGMILGRVLSRVEAE
jgi:hypothetical protein